MNLFRDLTPEEVIEYQQWTRENFKVGMEINSLWHPVIQEYCSKMINGAVLHKRIVITHTMIDKCFMDTKDQGADQSVVLERLYRLALPMWDDLVHLHGWPTVSEKTWTYIMDKAQKFDCVNYPDVMAGGFWFNTGFAVNHAEEDDQIVDYSHCELERKNNES